jgi:hypothetical protein
MPELKTASAFIFRLKYSLSGIFKINLQADNDIDIIIADKNEFDKFSKDGVPQFSDKAILNIKSKQLEKVIEIGDEEKYLILLNSGSKNINYSISIDEYTNNTNSNTSASVSGYFTPKSS